MHRDQAVTKHEFRTIKQLVT